MVPARAREAVRRLHASIMFFGGMPGGGSPFGGMPGMDGMPGGMPGGMGGGGSRGPVDTKALYETLEVDKKADQSAIKKAFRRLALKKHPDKGGDPGASPLRASPGLSRLPPRPPPPTQS